MAPTHVVLKKVAELITNDTDVIILDARVLANCLRHTNYRYRLESWDSYKSPGTIIRVPGTLIFLSDLGIISAPQTLCKDLGIKYDYVCIICYRFRNFF